MTLDSSLEVQDKLSIIATFDEIAGVVPEVGEMVGFDQRSPFHSLTLDGHTKKVVSGLEGDSFIAEHSLKDWILLAAKLHDVGKISPDGRQDKGDKYQYVGHEIESERMVRDILPKYFQLSEDDTTRREETDFVAGLAGLHAGGLALIGSFDARFKVGEDGVRQGEIRGSQLQAFEGFLEKVNQLPPASMPLIEKMKIVIALNRADKMGGFDETSDMMSPKVIEIVRKADAQVGSLNEMERALPAIIEAVSAKKSGNQDAGVVIIDGNYQYSAERPKKQQAGIDGRVIGLVAKRFGELEVNPEKKNDFFRILREEGFSGLGKNGYGRQVGMIKGFMREEGLS